MSTGTDVLRVAALVVALSCAACGGAEEVPFQTLAQFGAGGVYEYCCLNDNPARFEIEAKYSDELLPPDGEPCDPDSIVMTLGIENVPDGVRIEIDGLAFDPENDFYTFQRSDPVAHFEVYVDDCEADFIRFDIVVAQFCEDFPGLFRPMFTSEFAAELQNLCTQEPLVDVTVELQGEGRVVITWNDGADSRECTQTCVVRVPRGATVQLQADAPFDSWENVDDRDGTFASIVADEDRTVTALFG